MKGALPTGYVTSRELEVWRHVALGQHGTVIASAMGIGLCTVDKHRTALCRKLGARCSSDLTRMAIERGVIAVQVRPLQQTTAGRFTRHLL